MTDKSDYDRELAEFRAAIKDVKPILNDRAETERPVKRVKDRALHYRRKRAEESEELIIDGLSSAQGELLDPEQKVLFATPGIQARLLKRLVSGHMGWEASLDLHGYTADRARDELTQFMQLCQRKGLRTLLIVHGKAYTAPGKPAILKTYVTEWLRQIEGVLAFSSAQAKDGGTGALYVLVKRKRTSQN